MLCIIQYKPNSKFLIVNYLPIAKTLQYEMSLLEFLFDQPNQTAKSILQFVKSNNNLKILLKYFDYCTNLSAAFQGIPSIDSEFEQQYSSDLNNYPNNANKIIQEKSDLKNKLLVRFQAYHLSVAIEHAELQRKLNQIIAYSHRKVGWSTPEYFLNKNFSLEIKTNFGYGSVSYFYTRLRYKGFDIVPFSEWIVYEKAKIYEIVKYSASHTLEDSGWIDALNYACEACNLSLKDEVEFVRKYMIEECEKLSIGLENIMKNSNFRFLTWNRIYTDKRLDSHNLIEFRGEKISGALSFISNILKFASIIEIDEFIDRILNCNKKILPILQNEIPLIEEKLGKLLILLNKIEPIYLEVKEKYHSYMDKKDLLRNSLIEKHGEPYEKIFFSDTEFKNAYPSLKPLEEIFINDFPEFDEIEILYMQKQKEYRKTKSLILSLKTTMNNISEYIASIEKYFDEFKISA